MNLNAHDLTLSYPPQTVIHNVSFALPPGKVTIFIGANGCGKSTLLKACARQLAPQQGEILLDGKDIYRMPAKAFARRIAMLAQSAEAPEHLTVEQLVRYGRYPHRHLLSAWTAQDEACVAAALRHTQTEHYADRTLSSLSGGQRQRVWIAVTLAQDTPFIFLDEPTTYLDLTHQIEVLDLLKSLNRDQSKTVVMVLHDLNLAARYADHIVAILNGTIELEGAPAEVFTEDNIRRIFGLDNKIIQDPYHGTPICIPLSR